MPVAFRTFQSFLEVGFILREDVIKHQWQYKYSIISAEGTGASEFLFDPFFSLELAPADRGVKKKTVDEHLFVFRKPGESEKTKKFKESMF